VSGWVAVSDKVGFKSLSHFSDAFKRKYGYIPSSVSKNLTKKSIHKKRIVVFKVHISLIETPRFRCKVAAKLIAE